MFFKVDWAERDESNLMVFMETPKDLCGAFLSALIYLEKL